MKKFPLLVTMLMIAALVLAACGGAGDDTATPGVDLTPGTGGLETPVVGTDVVEPTVDAVLDVTPTADVLAETPATGDVTTPTTEGATGEVPVTGDDDCNPNTIQGLLDMDVVDSTGVQIGDVNSVIVLRDASAMPVEPDGGTGAQVTPAAGDVTPVAGDVVKMAAPQLAYLVLDLEDNDNDVVVPFQAFDLTVKSQGVGGAGNVEPAATVDPLATPVAGDMANEAVVCAITLDSAQASALSTAPVFSDDLDLSVADWDNAFRTFWSGQGLSIPATGSSNMGAPVVLDDEFDDINALNHNGEDLGEVEDFILDQQTGSFNYAVLAAGGFLGIGEKYIPVPMSMVQWVSDDPGDLDDAGQIIINISDDDWPNAPSFDSRDAFNTSVDGWDSDLRNFWDDLDGSTVD